MDWKELGLTCTTQGRHKYSNVFVKRRGARASLNQPLVTRRMNARVESLHMGTQGKGLHTHTEDKFLNAFVRGEVHGQSRTLPYHKTHEHVRNFHTREAKFRMPWSNERCMGKPERSLVTSHTKTQARFTHERQ